MKKLLALFLALALMASFSVVFSASEGDGGVLPEETLPPEESPSTEPTGESLLTADLKKQIVPEDEVPDLIDYSVAVAEQYVCRAYWEETDLNEVVFLKSDGTLARYYFAIPVKYEENGEIFDKKPALVERETLLADLYRYELTAQNDTAFYCPDNLTHGFLYQGGDMAVALRPITQSEYDFLRGHVNAGDLVVPGNAGLTPPVGYDSQAVTGVAQSALSVTDEETIAPRYVLSTEGEQVNSAAASQDILSAVPSYNGFQLQLNLAEGTTAQTVYFELDSQLLPVPTEGGLLLCDQKGDPVGILGDLLSESGVQNDIPWTVTQSLSGTYLLSATLPRNGQTYTVSTTQYFDYLLDATIYSVRQQNYGQSANLWIGYHSSDGMERVLIRPNNWYFTETAISNQVVQSASVVLRDITATEHEAGIEVRPFFGEVWQENTVTWDAVDGTDYGAVLDTKAVSAEIGWNEGYYYSFNVTQLVQNWYTGVSLWQQGMIFRWNVDTMCYPMEKCFASSQYSNENYRPRLEITTAALSTIESGVYHITPSSAGADYRFSANPMAVDNDATTGVPETSTVYIQPEQSNAMHQMWRITHIQNNYYTIRPYHYTPAGLYASETGVMTSCLGYSDLWEEVDSGFLWYIGISPVSSGGDSTIDCFYVKPFGSGLCLKTSGPITMGDVSLGDNYGGVEHKWNFSRLSNPSSAVLYYTTAAGINDLNPIYSIYAGESRTLKSIGLLVSMSVPPGVSLDVSSYNWSTSDSEIVGYDSIMRRFSSEGLGVVSVWPKVSFASQYEYSFRICSYGEGSYYLRNEASGRYLDLFSDYIDVGESLCQEAFSASPTSEFTFIRHENGYYTIHPAGNTYYCLVTTLNPDDEYEVFLGVTEDDDSCYWNVALTPSGNFRIGTKLNRAMVLSLDQQYTGSITNSGIELVLHSNNDDYCDEWFITEYAYQLTLYNYYDSNYIRLHGEMADPNGTIEEQHHDKVVEKMTEALVSTQTYLKEVLGLRLTFVIEHIETYLDECDATKSLPDDNDGESSNDTEEKPKCEDPTHAVSDWDGSVYYCTDREGFFLKIRQIEGYTDFCNYGYVFWVGYDFGAHSNVGNITMITESMGSDHALLHELAHQFGAPDHYCRFDESKNCMNAAHCNTSGHQPTNGEVKIARDGSCVMDNDYEDDDVEYYDDYPRWEFPSYTGSEDLKKTFEEIVEILYCDHCKADIFAHLEQNGHAIP